MKVLLLLTAIILTAGFIWLSSGPEPRQSIIKGKSQESEMRAAIEPLPVRSVLRVHPKAELERSRETGGRKLSWVPTQSAQVLQFSKRQDIASLYKNVEDLTSPEALYLKASIYSLCARRSEKTASQLSTERDGRRAAFLAGFSGGAALSPERLNAFDKLSEDSCAGLDLGAFSAEQLSRMVEAAASAGDPRAQAWQLAERLEKSYQDAVRSGTRRAGYELSTEDFERARQLLSLGDPDVIEDLQGILSSSLEHGSIRLRGDVIDPAAMHLALALLSCDAGAECGPQAPQILTNCAYRGRCAAQTVSDYTFFYETSPAQAQLIDSYHQALLAMLNAHDFSGLTISSSGAVAGFSMIYGGRRGGGSP